MKESPERTGAHNEKVTGAKNFRKRREATHHIQTSSETEVVQIRNTRKKCRATKCTKMDSRANVLSPSSYIPLAKSSIYSRAK